MNFNEYQQKIRVTAQYPSNLRVIYPALGLGGESGEVLEKIKKVYRDKIEGFIQVVGHTTQNKLVITDDIILIDTLGTSGEYLIWDNFQLSVGKGF